MLKGISHLSKMLTLAGFALILVAYSWYLYIDLMTTDFSFASATVVDKEYSFMSSEDTALPVVHFMDDEGSLFELLIDDLGQAGELSEGDSVNIMYLSSFPASAMIYNSFTLWGGPFILLVISLLMITPQLMATFKPEMEMEPLIVHEPVKDEISIFTQFVNVEKNRGSAVNGIRPFCIYSQWRNPDTAEIHFFRSKDLWTDPSEYIKMKRITVFVNEDDLSQYKVDLSFLPEHIFQERRLS